MSSITCIGGNGYTVVDPTGETQNAQYTFPGLNLNAQAVYNATTNSLYVPDSGTNLLIFNMSTNVLAETISTAPTTGRFAALNKTTQTLYVASSNSNTLIVFNCSLNTFSTVTLNARTLCIATNELTNTVYIGDTQSNGLIVFNGVTNAITTTIVSIEAPWGVVVNPNTNTIYVAQSYYTSPNICIISGTTNTITGTIGPFNTPTVLGINILYNTLYVADIPGGGMKIVNLVTNTITPVAAIANCNFFLSDDINNIVYVAGGNGFYTTNPTSLVSPFTSTQGIFTLCWTGASVNYYPLTTSTGALKEVIQLINNSSQTIALNSNIQFASNVYSYASPGNQITMSCLPSTNNIVLSVTGYYFVFFRITINTARGSIVQAMFNNVLIAQSYAPCSAITATSGVFVSKFGVQINTPGIMNITNLSSGSITVLTVSILIKRY